MLCPDQTPVRLRETEAAGRVAPSFRIQVTANFTAEPLARVLRFWAVRLGWEADSVQFSPYGQVFQELLAPESESAAVGAGANVFLVRVEDWGREAPAAGKTRVVEEAIAAFVEGLIGLMARTPRPAFVFLARPSGGAAGETPAAGAPWAEFTRDLAERLMGIPNVTVVDHASVASLYATGAVEDFAADREWHIPFAEAYWIALGTLLMRRVRAVFHPPHKVIVVDADNTLWDRVVAEAGAEGIGLGTERLALQRILRDRQGEGLLLALASKNREEDVRAAFARPEMILRWEDFVAWKVNWQPKSENLREIADELGLGLESFVFLDDNPVECAEVSSRLPQVAVVNLPTEAASATEALRHVWALDASSRTALDRQRTEQYRQRAERQRWRERTGSFREFIESLQLQVECFEPGPEDLERAAQLTQRTNQFNTTGVRWTVAELSAWREVPGHGCFLVRVVDRFGDYGIVGFVAYRVADKVLEVEQFLLSCRVLGKGVEHRMFAELGSVAARRNAEAVRGALRRTERNEPAERFLRDLVGPLPISGGFAIPVTQARAVRFVPGEREPAGGSEASSRSSAVTNSSPRGPGVDFAEIALVLRDGAALRRALRRDSFTPRRNGTVVFASPRPGVEERLAWIWEDVLGVAPVGREDSFLELGGHSIQAAQLSSRILATWGARIPLADFFAHPRLSALAQHLHRILGQTGSTTGGPVSGIARPGFPRAESAGLSPAQERMWFLDQFIPRRAAYNIVLGWRIRGALDREAWRAALRAVVRRHEPLRSTIRSEGPRRVVTVVEDPVPVAEFLEARTEAEALAGLREAATTPFDLASAPLLRTRVISLGPEDHACVFVVHHVAADGWSMGILFQEWSVAQAAAKAGRAPAWEPLPARYRDYAAWLQTPEVTEVFAADLDYWKGRLAGVPRLLELPTDLPRPAVLTYEGAAEEAELAPEVVAAVEQLAAREGTTPFAILMAAFQAWLHRYTGQTDLVVGTPVSGRNHPAIEGLVGCFVNTIVVRNEVLGTTPFRDQIRAVSQTVWEALAHDQLPFERLVDALKLERDLSHSPLFQVMLVFQNAPPGAPIAEGWQVSPLTVHNTGAKFDLVLEITPRSNGGGYGLVLEYNAGMFRPETMRRWLGHYARLLAAACQAPESALGVLPLMGESELVKVRAGFSEARHRFPAVECLHRWFARQANRTPDALAVTCAGQALTYQELDRQANRLAHHLIRSGVGPDTLVGLCLDRSLEMVVAILAVLKAGGAYLPIDLSYPADRLAFMLEDARAPVLLTQRSLLEALPPTPAHIVLVDADQAFWAEESGCEPAVEVAPDHLAYVIYTSGSTGKPKGCMITHRNVARLMLATEAWFGFGPTDVWTLFHSYAFDFSVWEIWGALLYGGRLVVVPHLVSRSPEAFYRLLASEGVTVLNQTPSAFRQLIQVEENGTVQPLALRYVIFGGEALEMQSLRPWFDRHGDERPRLVNMYGITETTVHVTYRPLTRGDVAKASVVGVPIPDLEFHILDTNRNPVPLGIPGEIYVGGGGVARGYLRRDELTAERFVPHPFRASGLARGIDATGPDRLYRTGDLARFLPGGDVEYLGRIDSQVKIRGFRIELGEIESVLCRHEAVREAVVLAREDRPGEKRLVGYLVVGAGRSEPAAKELREHLKRQVPEYMVPSAFVFLPRLPLTGNGKIDRRALPDPGIQRLPGVRPGVAPNSALERSIASICQEALRVENLGVEDNFFDLGAHSILLVGIHRRLQSDLDLCFPLVSMFHYPTIRALAHHLAGEAAPTTAGPTPPDSGGAADRARRQREATRKLRQQRAG